MKKSWCLGLVCIGVMVSSSEKGFGQYLYWVDASFASPTLNRSDLGGGSTTTIPLNAKSLPEGLVVDAMHSTMYFGELAYTNAHVSGAFPNLSGIVPIVTGGSAIRGIAIDPVASKVYWTTSNLTTGATIEKANLDGTGRQTVYQFAPGSGTNLRGVAVDSTNLYWADFASGKVLRGDVAGSTIPVDMIAGLSGPVGVALGDDGYLYWTEANANVIKRRAFISGTITTLVSGLSAPNYIAVDGTSGQMFWTEIGIPRIRKADLNGANVQTLPLPAVHPTGIAATSSPLATQLASFVGSMQGNHVRLEWRTLIEVNNYGFFVQRRHESETVWTDLPKSFVAGHGTVTVPHDYVFVDSSAGPGNNAYRLKQVDADGTENFSASISVSVLTTVQEVGTLAFALEQNYPNPFNPATTIRYTVAGAAGQGTGAPAVRLAVYDLLGREVSVLVNEPQTPGSHEVRFDATGLASGTYFYRLSDGYSTDTRKLLLMY